MNKLIPEYSVLTFKMYDGKTLIIENYKQLIDVSDQCIEIDNYLLKGKNLKIDTLNQFMVKVHGVFKEIIIK